MKLDLRRPALVVAGSWNPQVFTPQWLVRNLFEVPEGENVEIGVLQEFDVPNRTQKDTIFFKEIGFYSTTSRFEVTRNNGAKKTAELAENVALRTISSLPHTPLNGFGCNLRFFETDPDDAIVDKIKTRDKIDELYTITSRSFKSTIDIRRNVELNLTVTRNQELVTFDFNYHHSGITSENASELIVGSITKYLDHAVKLLKEVYGIEGYDLQLQEFAPQQPGDDE